MIVLEFFYLIIVGALLYISYTHKFFKYYTSVKAAAGLCFVAVAFFKADSYNVFQILMLSGMILCLSGDVFLGLANNIKSIFTKMFISGVVAFAAAHILFAAAFVRISPLSSFDVVFSISCLIATYFIISHKSFRIAKMKVPVLIYSIFVGMMCSKGIGAFFALQTQQGVLIAIGAILFLISDCSLLFLYFTVKKPRRFVRVFNLLTYYIAMFCIAVCM